MDLFNCRCTSRHYWGIGVRLYPTTEKQDDSLVEDKEIFEQPIDIPDVNESHETESSLRRKQLEKLAKDKPDEFAKLLRSWIGED